MTRRRGRTLAFSGLMIATGTAFATGTYLHGHHPHHRIAASTRLAQATGDGTPTLAIARQEPDINDAAPEPARRDGKDDGSAAQATFETVYNLVKEQYVDKLPSDRTMSQGAVRAMIASLNDPNSYFLEPEQRAALDAEAKGRFGGIGAGLSVRSHKVDGYTESKIVVVAPLPGSPAEKAGLLPGDTILRVDNKWVLGSDPFLRYNKLARRLQSDDVSEEEAAQEYEAARRRVQGGIGLLRAQMLLRMGSGEHHILSVQRAGASAPIAVNVTTAITTVPPIAAKRLNSGISYLRIPVFTEQSAGEFSTVLATLPPQGELVLDLRDNPGGLIDSARPILGALAPGSRLLTETVAGNKRLTLTATGKGSAKHRPIVVLINKGTGSTAEALAESLADQGLATVMGNRSFGDAVAQTFYPLPDGSAFVLTTGQFASPHGITWENTGITPRIALAPNATTEQILSRAVSLLKAHSHIVLSHPARRAQ